MISRYQNAEIVSGGQAYGSGRAHELIREGVKSGTIPFSEDTIRESQRLDHVAGVVYGDSSLWWVIAAASEIGWGLQVPPGTYIRIPDLSAVTRVLS